LAADGNLLGKDPLESANAASDERRHKHNAHTLRRSIALREHAVDLEAHPLIATRDGVFAFSARSVRFRLMSKPLIVTLVRFLSRAVLRRY
jgi:hypothetical protein